MEPKIIVYWFLSIVFLSSCKKEKDRPPLNYEEETIQKVMIDMYVASSALDKVDELLKDSLREVYMLQIEKIHEVELSIIEEDILAVKQNPKWYLELHTEVKDSLYALEKRAKNANKKPKKKSESQTDISKKMASKKGAQQKNRK